MLNYNLKEDIYGNRATVYHRTKADDLIDSIKADGFKPGGGDFYGVGFYSTYDLESQMKINMQSSYGPNVVKFSVDLTNFFFCDYNEFEKTPLFREHNKKYPNRKFTELNFIKYQFRYYKMEVGPEQAQKWQEETNDKRYTSDVARIFVRSIPYFEKKCAGIVFTGRSDGLVLVAYNLDQVKPMSYVDDEIVEPKTMVLEGSLYAQIIEDEDRYLNGVVSYSLWYIQGNEYEEEASATPDTMSSFNIHKLDYNSLSSPELSFLSEFDDFSVHNGSGIYVEYEDDHTPEDAEQEANRIWNPDDSTSLDDGEFVSELEKYLGENIEYDYLIMRTNGRSFPSLMLAEWIKYNFSNLSNSYLDTSCTDYSGQTYEVYYKPNYDYISKFNPEYTSTPAQRKRDHQLDLDFGL